MYVYGKEVAMFYFVSKYTYALFKLYTGPYKMFLKKAVNFMPPTIKRMVIV